MAIAKKIEISGEKVQSLRNARGLSRAELCNVAGISTNTLFEIENDKRTPHTVTIRAIADALGVAVEELEG